MPEWLLEHGIGETRAVLVEDGEIVEARIQLEGAVRAGSVVPVRLASVGTNGRNAIAVGGHGTEYLLPRGAAGATEGATISVEVTREAIPGSEPWKRALARVTDKPPQSPQELGGRSVPFPAPVDHFADLGWDDLIEEARTGIVTFAGGELRVSPTPAMTLIDVDGQLPPLELARVGAEAAGRTIVRHGIGGSIGIDLPTVGGKLERQAIAAAVDAILPQPFERTAVNGFGFLQIVRPRRHASLFELAQDRAAFESRALLRRTALEEAGPKRLVAHPVVTRILEARPEWIHALSGQIGGEVELRPDATLPISGAYAEKF